MTQDLRVTVDEQTVEDFFVFIANHVNEEVIDLLKDEPTLIYAQNELGSTAIQTLIAMGQQADLETLRVILATARENGVLPDYTQTNNRGDDAYVYLQLNAGSALNRQFAAEIGVQLSAPSYSSSSSDTLVESARAYLERSDIAQSQQTLKKIETGGKSKGSSFFSWNVQEIKYNNDVNDLFKKMYTFTNLDEQKKFNTLDAEVDAMLKTLSFTPASPISFIPGMGSEPTIIVMPKELSDLFGKVYDYFFGHEHQQ